jgi:hypothetical protein
VHASDLQYPNFAALLIRAIDNLHSEGMMPFTDMELVVVGHIAALEEGNSYIGERVVYEVDNLNIPKWVLLVSWLSPFGLSSHHPKMVLRLAKYLLGDTRRQEEAGLPRNLKTKFGV